MLKFLLAVLVLLFLSCNRSRDGRVHTPKAFVNRIVVHPSLYSGDSTSILHDLYKKMKNHETPFENDEYFDSTKLYLDTILYDSTFNKVALFAIAENPVYRNKHSDSKLPYYYNANCYLGKRMSPSSGSFELKNIGPVSIINFDDKITASDAIREVYYSELTLSLDADKTPFYDYNIDDKRFWGSEKGWKRVFP